MGASILICPVYRHLWPGLDGDDQLNELRALQNAIQYRSTWTNGPSTLHVWSVGLRCDTIDGASRLDFDGKQR